MIGITRTCDGCTACCEGWLSGSAHGKEFYPGFPCHFASCNGCTIYDDRPEHPCISYSCLWLRDTDVPEWLKPSESGVIITAREWDHPDGSKQTYLDVVETGRKIDSSVLNWFFRLYLRTQIPLKIQIGGGQNLYGTEEFIKSQQR
jgi:hypothetical protein